MAEKFITVIVFTTELLPIEITNIQKLTPMPVAHATTAVEECDARDDDSSN